MNGISLIAMGANAGAAGNAGAGAPALTGTTASGVIVNAGGPNARALNFIGTGGNGAVGADAGSDTANGGAGGSGGAGSAMTITNGAALSSASTQSLQTQFQGTHPFVVFLYLATFLDPDTIDTPAEVQAAIDAAKVLDPVIGALLQAQVFSAIPTENLITASSAGIFALSTGGNGARGGEGGTELNNGLNPNGGAGGSGGAGGALSATNTGAIATTGDYAPGVLSVSRGGNGASGGLNAGPNSGSGSAGISGPAGAGGAGGIVSVANSAAIHTAGDFSYGLLALSAGGQGGAGSGSGIAANGGTGGAGAAVTAALLPGSVLATAGLNGYGVFARSAGGAGGDGVGSSGVGGTGGAAAAVNVSAGGSITTTGLFAHGVFASSIGGSGGAGGGSGMSAAAGGSGGAAGAATVTADDTARITTGGYEAHAILAQSAGGLGGTGGDAAGLWATSGGGGNGGRGGTVYVDNKGVLRTSGEGAYGLFAQSVGGLGGAGGYSTAFVAFGGAAGGGTIGGNVTVDNYGSIATSGVRAHGIFAQSAGGGGGDAGGTFGLVALGGAGSAEAETECRNDASFCNHGGVVTVTNSGAITTLGNGAHAIYAQSIGGGGGNGGSAGGLVTIGGAGGAGGNGGVVTVENSGTVVTAGANAFGVNAQSVGGGGGSGGSATSIGAGLATVSLGGSGGSGGVGGNVSVNNFGLVGTSGFGATGIDAQSVGGGGGRAGDATSAGATVVTLAIGGSGGDGGHAGSVSVNNTGSIVTRGEQADAVSAQSVGGGGGRGGAAYTFGASAFVSAAISLGGSGGKGGDGNTVDVANANSIATFENDSRGIFAQSIGGGGGRGGSASASAISASPNYSLSVAVAVGGSGGDGGNGGAVNVGNTGSVTTWGDNAVGVQSQSVGGGGGTGGDASAMAVALASKGAASVSVGVGGNGGGGGHGGSASVTSAGAVQTAGDFSHGVFAQSVGGGGGVGGAGTAASYADTIEIQNTLQALSTNNSLSGTIRDKISAIQKNLKGLRAAPKSASRSVLKALAKDQLKDLATTNSVAVAVGVGGQGGAAGDGGTVNVNSTGEIVTIGSNAYGVVAQSIGGGGGMGGAGKASTKADVGVGSGWGGDGGGAGHGGAVSVVNNGAITTVGPLAYAILAQSVGGGGGVGGLASGSGEIKSFTGLAGGDGGAFGNGGSVTVQQNGAVLTIGAGAIGVLAQSVGGGGGILTTDTSTYTIDTGQSGAGGTVEAPEKLNISVAGRGGAGGNGGTVNVAVNGNITTLGDGAHGVLAQSVGGGGGLAGSVTNKTLTFSVGTGPFGIVTIAGDGPFGVPGISKPIDTNIPFSAGLSFGGGGASAGNGGNVVVATSGVITTSGAYANGIVAQSLGGGGGLGGSAALGAHGNAGFAGSAGGGGTAGKIEITHQGSVLATGLDAHGIFAQSMDGVGESLCIDVPVGFAGSGTGKLCGGDGSQTTSTGRGGNVTIDVGGTISGGSGAGAGIFVSGGATNTITNNGGIIRASSGIAIMGTDGDDRIVNAGLIQGDVGLGGGANAFENRTAGVFEPGGFVYLNGAALSNDGAVAPGGIGNVTTTYLHGSYGQSTLGRYLVDVRFGGGASDLTLATGTASVAGHVRINLLALENKDPVTVMRAAGGVTDNGATAIGSLVARYGLKFTPTEMQVTIEDVNFVIASGAGFGGLTPNEKEVARHFNTVWSGGNFGGLGPALTHFINILDPVAYAAALDRLHPEPYLANVNASIYSALGFTDGLMSCRGFDGTLSAIRENTCSWAKFTGTIGEQSRTHDWIGHRDQVTKYQAGHQQRLNAEWLAGFAFGYEREQINVDDRAVTTGERYNAGLALKYQSGRWLLSAAAAGAYGDFETRRFVNVPTPNLTATATSHAIVVDGRLRAAYLAELGALYVRPSVDVDVIYYDMPSFRETGAGAVNLDVQGTHAVLFAATPAIELGALFRQDSGLMVRPYVNAGVTFLSKNELQVTSFFEGSPASAGTFVTWTPLPNVLGKLSSGLEILSAGGLDLRLQYESRLGHNYIDHSGGAKLTVRY